MDWIEYNEWSWKVDDPDFSCEVQNYDGEVYWSAGYKQPYDRHEGYCVVNLDSGECESMEEGRRHCYKAVIDHLKLARVK